MRRLLYVAVIISMLFAASVSMVVFAARSQPLDDHLALLHLDQCAPPCWLGINPGQIARPGMVEAAIRSAYSAPRYTITPDDNCPPYSGQCYFIQSEDKRLFRIQANQGSSGRATNTITSILLSFDDPYNQQSDYRFGEFFALFGEPVKTRLLGTFKYPRSNEMKDVIYVKSEGTITVTGFDGDLTTNPAKQVKALLFSAPDPSLTAQEIQQQSRIFPWMGFMTTHGFWTKTCERRGMC